MVKKQYLNNTEAARYLGISRYALYVCILYGKGPTYISAGRTKLFSLSDLDKFKKKIAHGLPVNIRKHQNSVH